MLLFAVHAWNMKLFQKQNEMFMADKTCWLIVVGNFPLVKLLCRWSYISSSWEESSTPRNLKQHFAGKEWVFRSKSLCEEYRSIIWFTPVTPLSRWSEGCSPECLLGELWLCCSTLRSASRFGSPFFPGYVCFPVPHFLFSLIFPFPLFP